VTDIFPPGKRSEIMGRIRSRSGLDRRVSNWLKAKHIRHRMYPRVEGGPDIHLRDADVYLFLDSCFFHGCPEHYREPKSNVGFWREKIRRNRERDAKRGLLPYRWIAIWEHDVRSGRFREIIQELGARSSE